MRINYTTNEIIISKEESRQAATRGTEKFNELTDLMSKFNGYKVVVKSSAKSKDNFKGLTYGFIEKYINAHQENREENLKAFYELRGLNEDGSKNECFIQVASYGEIKTWFLKHYPEVAKPNEELEKLRAEIRQSRVA